MGNYQNVERMFKRFLGATSDKCLLQIIFLSICHWENSYLRIVSRYVYLRYPRLQFNSCEDGSGGDDAGDMH